MKKIEKKAPDLRFKGFVDDWEQDKLEDKVESIGTGKSSFKIRVNSSDENPYPVLGSTSVISYDREFDYSGDFVLTARVGANAGNLYNYSGKVKISDNTVYVQSNNLNFIYYLLTKFDLKRLSFGTGQPLIKASELKALKLVFPKDSDEQQKIGTFFENMDKLIAIYENKLIQLQGMKKNFLQQMFPSNSEVIPKLRFTNFQDLWRLRKLGDEVTITMGQSPSSNNYTKDPNDFILVQGNADIKNGRVSPRVWTTQITKRAEKNDLILSVRAPVGDIGKTDYDVVIGRGVSAIKGNEFIFQQLGKMKSAGYWTRYSTGSTFESINSNDIKDAEIMITNLKEQQKIGNFFQQFDDIILLYQNKLTSLQNIKKAYLQKMFI